MYTTCMYTGSVHTDVTIDHTLATSCMFVIPSKHVVSDQRCPYNFFLVAMYVFELTHLQRDL